mgnify:CR=1 FL=1
MTKSLNTNIIKIQITENNNISAGNDFIINTSSPHAAALDYQLQHDNLELNDENKNLIMSEIIKSNIENIDVVSDEGIKSKILSNSVFAVSKSGTVSLQISSSNIPSIIIYKLSFINFMIFKMLVNVKFANIINIINNREVIPELLQNECNADEIYRSVIYLLKNPELIKKQLSDCSKTLEGIRSKTSSSEEACLVLRNYLS